MRWKRGYRSRNVEDRRGQGFRSAGMGGGLLLRFLPMLLGRKGGVKIALLIGAGLIGAHFLGIDVSKLLGGSQGLSGGGQQVAYKETPETKLQAEFIAFVLDDTENSWKILFAQQGLRYQAPTLVLFSGATSTACGHGQAAMGPFYCPGDKQVYIDLSFFRDLKVRHGAAGDFAQAYVIAHEIGHHVQNLLGTSTQVHKAQQRLSKAEANQLSVRLELQADCYAGLWANNANNARQILEAGDVDEALTAAGAIGDDRLQRQAQGRVVPESFTHGTSEQRIRWFKTGLAATAMNACDTFNARRL